MVTTERSVEGLTHTHTHIYIYRLPGPDYHVSTVTGVPQPEQPAKGAADPWRVALHKTTLHWGLQHL